MLKTFWNSLYAPFIIISFCALLVMGMASYESAFLPETVVEARLTQNIFDPVGTSILEISLPGEEKIILYRPEKVELAIGTVIPVHCSTGRKLGVQYRRIPSLGIY